MKPLLLSILVLASSQAFAQQAQFTPRVGLGQPSAEEPATLGNLKLTDPLVRQKYLNEPDMLRFLRGTYSEACARGLVKEAADQIKLDVKREYSSDARLAATRLIESNRVWKLTSMEMEALFGAGYTNAANYCDCLLKEVPDQDLVNPKKGLEVIEKISASAQKSCEQYAKEQTQAQITTRAKFEKK